MIIQLKGKVAFPITLDPSVWIFDDRKISLEEAFTGSKEKRKEDPLKKAAELFDQEIYFQKSIKPPVNKSLTKEEKEKALTHSFVMPMKDFINTAEVDSDAERVQLKIPGDDDVYITVEQLRDAVLLFAIKGKPLKENGPVHLIFGDGSNRDNPIKGIQKIIFE